MPHYNIIDTYHLALEAMKTVTPSDQKKCVDHVQVKTDEKKLNQNQMLLLSKS